MHDFFIRQNERTAVGNQETEPCPRIPCGLNRLRAYALVMPCSRMMLPMRLLDAVTPLPFQGGLDLPGAVAFAAVAPDRTHVAGDRIRTLRPGMPGHPVVGGAGNAQYPALRRYRVAGGVGPYHVYFRALPLSLWLCMGVYVPSFIAP